MIKAIIFDIDGVLLDSFEANLEFFQELIKNAGYKPPTREEYAPYFHRTLRDTVKGLTGLTEPAEIEKICISENYAKVRSKSPVLSEGAAEAVKDLSKHYSLAVVTSRIKEYVYEPPLDTLKSYFKTAVTYEDTVNHKPHPEPLLLAAKQLGVSPAECVYVGDVENDLIAARAAGMKFLLYAKEKIKGTDASTDDFKEIPEIMKEEGIDRS